MAGGAWCKARLHRLPEVAMFGSVLGLSGSGGARRLMSMIERSGFRSGTAVEAEGDALTALSEGLLAATLIATEQGWVPASRLRPGDRIVTFDSGLQTLRAVSGGRLVSRADLPRGARPLAVPPGALGNRQCITLLPGQSVLIESDAAEAAHGDPFVLIPAAALDGWNGIARIEPEAEVEVVFLDFDGDEVVYAEGMTLIHCPRRAPLIVATADALIAAGSGTPHRSLPLPQARALLAADAG
jgi:hypothetical protein